MIYFLIIPLISELICWLVHVQLVSLLQWHDNIFNNKQIYELVSTLKSSVSLLQWRRQCNDLLILIILLISELICWLVHMQLVSLLQWHLFSMQWSISSFYSSVNLIIHSHATSESATMTSFVNTMIYLLTLLYLSVNQSVDSFAYN